MESDSDPVLKQLTFEVAGTHHENRQRVIRTLNPEDPISLWKLPVVGKDENAIGVVIEHGRRKHQIGWVPWVMNGIFVKMDLKEARVLMVGTDGDGTWTRIAILVDYVSDRTSKDVEKYGPRVAGVLDRMLFKNLRFAKSIAALPTSDIQLAIEEYDAEGQMETYEHRKGKESKDE